MQSLGIDTLTTDRDDPSWSEKLYDRALQLYPPGEEPCGCRSAGGMMFMYGETYDHDQLNDATHEHIHEAFGVANMTTFKQITLALREGHVVAADGADVYLPATDNLRVPISFLHGENNRLFKPEGSQLTYDYLTEANGPDLYTRTVIPGYSHMDLFIGKDAARDVYPVDHGRARSIQFSPTLRTPLTTTRTNHWEHDDAPTRMQDLFSYPLMSALTERRTRRIPRGFSVNAGSLTHESHNDPAPLTPARGGHPRHLHHGDHRHHHARRAADQGQRRRRARHAVPQRPRAHGQQRRQLPGDPLLHDQRRRDLPAQAPDRQRGSRGAERPAAHVGGVDRRRLAVLRRAVQGAHLRQAARASRASGPTTSAGTPRPPTSPAPRCSTRSSTAPGSTSTPC